MKTSACYLAELSTASLLTRLCSRWKKTGLLTYGCFLLVQSGLAQAIGDTAFISAAWTGCDRSEAAYYQVYSPGENNAVIIKTYYIAGIPKTFMTSSSINPENFNGEALYFDSTGVLIGRGYFTNNKKTGQWTRWKDNGTDSMVFTYQPDGEHRNFTRLFREEYEKSKVNGVYGMPEEDAVFPDGNAGLKRFVTREFVPPVKNKKKGTFYLRFTVHENGTLSDPEIESSLCKACDKEALAMFTKMPNWLPGKMKGVAVKSKVSVPIEIN
jgi:hypothetical protein